MDRQRLTEVLQQIADNKDCEVEDVRREMQLAIDAAQKDTDPKIRALWESFPHEGDKVTPEDVVAFMYGVLMDEDDN